LRFAQPRRDFRKTSAGLALGVVLAPEALAQAAGPGRAGGEVVASDINPAMLALGRERHPDLAGIPHVYDYAKTPEDRQVFDLIFGLQAIGRPFAAPPGIPAERAAALRSAFMAMTKDERFLAEAQKLSLDVSPSTGESVQEFVTRIYASPKAIVDRAKDALRLD